MYSNGGEDTGPFNHAYVADVGATLFGVSADAIYQGENGAVNLGSSFDNMPNPLPSPGRRGRCRVTMIGGRLRF